MNDKELPFDIDLVYLWVDGNDPAWQAKHTAVTGHLFEDSPTDCKGRYAENDELKFSLRAIENYAPWVRRIFIVTDNQVPRWLDTSNSKIRIVDHTEIMPREALPCFNASLIEHYIYRISGLSEHFLFANDDTLLNRAVWASDFFTDEGNPIVRLMHKPFSKLRMAWKKLTNKKVKNYTGIVYRSAKMVEKRCGVFINGMPHHNIDAYLRSDYARVAEDLLRDEFQANLGHHVRHDDDVHRSVFSFLAVAEKRAQLKWVDSRESFLCQIQKRHHYKRLDEMQPTFFCMNDSEHCDDNDRAAAREYLERRFPTKSSFEK